MNLIEIFKPGRHRAMSGQVVELSEGDLRASAAAYDPALHEAPLVIGHPRTDAPAYGWVKELRYDDALNAIPDQVDPAFAEIVNAGRYKKRSASFYRPDSPNNPKPGVWYLRHVGFLGAKAPAVKGLRDVSFGDGEEDVVEVEFAEDDELLLWGRLMRGLSRYLSRQEQIAFAEPSAREPVAHPESTMTPEEIAKREAELQRREKAVHSKEAEFAEREKGLSQAETQRRRAETEGFVEGLVKDGKVLPRDKDGLTAFMAGLSGEGVVEFGEGDDQVKKPATEWLVAFLTQLPKQVEFGEFTPGEEDETAVHFAAPDGYHTDPQRAALHKKAKTYQSRHKVDFVTAVKAVGGR